MKKTVLLLLLTLAVSTLRAQPLSDEELLRELFRPSTSTMIAKGREMILAQLRSGDFEMVAQTRALIMGLSRDDDRNYVALTANEYLITMFLTRDFDDLVNTAAFADSLIRPVAQTAIMPPWDELSISLRAMARDSAGVVEARIAQTIVLPQERDLLILWFRSLIHTGSYADYCEVDRQADRYLSQYPNGMYSTFVVRRISFKPVEVDWGIGMSFGAGVGIPTGGMTSLCGVGAAPYLSVDVMYRRIYMALGVNAVIGELRKEVSHKELDFPRSATWTVGNLGAMAGYAVVETPRIRLVPYASLAMGWMQLGMDNPDKKNSRFNRGSGVALAWGAGVFCDIKFTSESFMAYDNRFPGMRNSYCSLRLRYHLSAADYAIPSVGRGMVHTFTVGMGLFSREIR